MKNIHFLKEHLHSREVHIVQISQKLQQLLPQSEKDAAGILDIDSADAFFRQHAFSEALQSAITPPAVSIILQLSLTLPQFQTFTPSTIMRSD